MPSTKNSLKTYYLAYATSAFRRKPRIRKDDYLPRLVGGRSGHGNINFVPVILYRTIVLVSDASELLPGLFLDLPCGWIAILFAFGANIVIANLNAK